MRHSIPWKTAVVLFLSMSFSVLGRGTRMVGRTVTPLDSVVRPDGTLDLQKGFEGNVDARGWNLVPGENGEPLFMRDTLLQAGDNWIFDRPAASADDNWDDRFGFPIAGINGTVRAMAISGSDVVVGGTFSSAGNARANYIARWNGRAWSSLGTGMNGALNAVAVRGGDIYAGGDFDQAGGVAANRIAKWDGSAWSPLGNGVNGAVNAIAVSGGDVYAGGIFTRAGGKSSSCIACWHEPGR